MVLFAIYSCQKSIDLQKEGDSIVKTIDYETAAPEYGDKQIVWQGTVLAYCKPDKGNFCAGAHHLAPGIELCLDNFKNYIPK